MKIWKYTLRQSTDMYNDNYCEMLIQSYEANFELTKRNEWYYFKDWVATRIPNYVNIEFEYGYPCKVVKGFDHQLNENELDELKINMKELLQTKLKEHKQKIIKKIDNKINNLNEEIKNREIECEVL